MLPGDFMMCGQAPARPCTGENRPGHAPLPGPRSRGLRGELRQLPTWRGELNRSGYPRNAGRFERTLARRDLKRTLHLHGRAVGERLKSNGVAA
jgi:hypothetical protein